MSMVEGKNNENKVPQKCVNSILMTLQFFIIGQKSADTKTVKYYCSVHIKYGQ